MEQNELWEKAKNDGYTYAEEQVTYIGDAGDMAEFYRAIIEYLQMNYDLTPKQ